MPKNKRGGVLSALGVDLSKVNIKYVLIAVAVGYGSEIPLNIYINRQEGQKGEKITALNKEKNDLLKRISKYKEVEKKIQDVVKQEKDLRKKKEIIESRMQSKKNPVRIMLYISKNIPESLWINKLTLKDEKIAIEGVTPTYKSIGLFIENLKSAVYFDKSLDFGGAETEIDKRTGRRTEKFKITGKIVRYN